MAKPLHYIYVSDTFHEKFLIGYINIYRTWRKISSRKQRRSNSEEDGGGSQHDGENNREDVGPD